MSFVLEERRSTVRYIPQFALIVEKPILASFDQNGCWRIQPELPKLPRMRLRRQLVRVTVVIPYSRNRNQLLRRCSTKLLNEQLHFCT
jgi:hypothetical protein